MVVVVVVGTVVVVVGGSVGNVTGPRVVIGGNVAPGASVINGNGVCRILRLKCRHKPFMCAKWVK